MIWIIIYFMQRCLDYVYRETFKIFKRESNVIRLPQKIPLLTQEWIRPKVGISFYRQSNHRYSFIILVRIYARLIIFHSLF